jgi:hypothetical protein
MAEGRPGALAEAWRSFARIEDARLSALQALQNPQALRVAILEDASGLIGSVNRLHLVEWVVLNVGILRLHSARSTTECTPASWPTRTQLAPQERG